MLKQILGWQIDNIYKTLNLEKCENVLLEGYMAPCLLSFFFFQDHKDEVTCVTYNWNDCYIASGSLSGEIILHSVTTNLSSTPFGHGSNQVQYGFFHNKGNEKIDLP